MVVMVVRAGGDWAPAGWSGQMATGTQEDGMAKGMPEALELG